MKFFKTALHGKMNAIVDQKPIAQFKLNRYRNIAYAIMGEKLSIFSPGDLISIITGHYQNKSFYQRYRLKPLSTTTLLLIEATKHLCPYVFVQTTS
jgi:hypothetical protein